jgi:hypothetical protein
MRAEVLESPREKEREMSATVAVNTPTTTTEPLTTAEVEKVTRRTVDRILTSFGVVAAVAFAVAGSLLLWGANFSNDYVHKELASQHVAFPAAAALKAEGRTDLVRFAGQNVTNGHQAQAYAGYINGHLKEIGGGKTYSQIDDRGAQAAADAAKASGASNAAQLQAKADALHAQRDTMFKGETLRGLLLSSYAWWTVGRIAFFAAIGAFAAAAMMGVLDILGWVHLRRLHS